MPRHPSLTLLAFAAATLGTACHDDPAPTFDSPIRTDVTLTAAASCDDLETSIEALVIQRVRAEIERERQWAKLDHELYGNGGASDLGAASADGGSSTSTTGGAPTDFTTTNVQVAGVDEPDFMKNDGTRILVLRGNTLFTARSWPPESLALAGQLQIEGYASEMFLDGNRAVVLSSVSLPTPGCTDGWCGRSATKLSVVDLTDLANPQLTDEEYVPGYNVAARRVGSSVRLVQTDYVNWPDGVTTYPSYEDGLYQNTDLLLQRLDELEAKDIALIRAQKLADWIPLMQRRPAGGPLVGVGYDCSSFYTSNAPVDLGITTVTSVDLDHLDATPARVSALVDGWQVYATADDLYVAAPHWWWSDEPTNQSWTYLHKFDFSDPAHPRYVASGGVSGTLLDQYALDELGGFLRVAATERHYAIQPPGSTWAPPETKARVDVLSQDGAQLTLVGQSEPLQDGESITAVRFMGTRGLVVTYLQTDPLYTLDLSDPTAPHVSGTLQVPGYSAYLQQLDDTHVVGLGVYVPDPSEGVTDWRARRMKLSVYDVSDFDAPKELQTLLIGNVYGWSDAIWDPHGFNYFASQKLLAIPYVDEENDPSGTDYWSGFTSQIRLFRFDPATGFTALGAMKLDDLYRTDGTWGWNTWYWPYARRSVMATAPDGETYLYGVTDAGLRVAKSTSPDVPVATAPFPPQTP